MIAITGAAGFIGSNLVHRLVGDGHEVRVLDDLCTGYRENLPTGVELIVGDVADEAVVRAAMVDVEVVFHGGDYDVSVLSRDHGFVFRRVFDTMIAATFLGEPALGLMALVEKEFGVRLSKKEMEPYEARLQRSPTLPKYDITIRPKGR